VILVTGGTGFIGSRITRWLLARNESVVCFDARPAAARLGPFADHPLLRVVEGDITRFADLAGAMRLHAVRRVIHTAAVLSQVCRTEPCVGVRINVVGTTNVFEAARQANVARVVYASSLVVHGSQHDHGDVTLTEDAPLFPRSFYAHTKVMNERTAGAYTEAFGLDCRCLRVSSPFGPGAPPGGAGGAEVTRLVALAAMGSPVQVQVGRNESPPITYVDDVAEIFGRLCLAERLSWPVYFCSAAVVPMEQIADMVARMLPDARISFGSEAAKVTLPYRLDAGRLEADIGYRLPPLEGRLRDHISEVRKAAGLRETGPGTD
jgi:UDP-glucose 4-epimerase